MEKHIRLRWDNEKLEIIANRFGIVPDQLTILDGFASFVYEYQMQGKGYILRVGHSSRRSMELYQGEVDWLNYLARNGARVAQAIESTTGNLVESLADDHGEYFLAVAFRKAPGDHLPHNEWTTSFVEHYGETIGQIHHLSKRYMPSNPAWRRFDWDDPLNIEMTQWQHVLEPKLMTTLEQIMQRLTQLPHDASYHIIHQDAHGGNFYVDEDRCVTLFDFDDCAYGHEIYDIAMCVFYGPVREDLNRAVQFATDFLTGYARENNLDPIWLNHLPDFIKLREIDLFAMIERDVNWRGGEDPWAERYMQGRYERLINDVPFIDFDFTSLASILS